jgi:hypothetical protein
VGQPDAQSRTKPAAADRATLSEAGAEASRLGNTIGDHVQETMDASLTKSAETQFLKSSQDLLYNPQSGLPEHARPQRADRVGSGDEGDREGSAGCARRR